VPRKVDPKQTRKALRIVRKLAAKGGAPETIDPETGEVKPGEGAVDYSHWENEFLSEVDKRLEKYGSAFNDLGKGRKDEALSTLQTVKLKEIAAKARGKKRKGLTTKKPLGWKKRATPSRDRDD
jgi:hypothetical protein